MDLNTLRTLHAIGNYPPIITELSTSAASPNDFNSEFIVLGWKSILKGTGDVSKCAQFLSSTAPQTASEILKKALMLWSKVYKNQLSNQAPADSDITAFKEIGLKAHEAVEIEQEERDQIILISAEALLMLSAPSESFSLLKLLKASNLDCQVLFIEILINFGQFSLARERLQKMRNIPEWKDDVRFLLIEALLGLHHDGECDGSVESFGVKDSLYSYQELIQVHGSTPRLLLHLAAAFVLLKKVTEAQSTLLQIPQSPETDSIVKANLLVIDALLNSPTFSLSCSVACCKVHKETCAQESRADKKDSDADADSKDKSRDSPTPTSLNDKLSSSTRLQSFLASSPYLSSHLPVLLARIDRHDTSTSNASESQLARDLERKQRIAEVLKEAIETDPKVAELYQLLLDENII